MTPTTKKPWQRPLREPHFRGLAAAAEPGHGGAYQRISATELRRAMGKYAGNRIRFLEARGLIRRTGSINARIAEYCITNAGLEALAARRDP